MHLRRLNPFRSTLQTSLGKGNAPPHGCANNILKMTQTQTRGAPPKIFRTRSGICDRNDTSSSLPGSPLTTLDIIII